MDVAYDHIQENSLPKTAEEEPRRKSTGEGAEGAELQEPTLNEDLQEAYKAISSSAWGSRIGGFFGTVVKQVCESAQLPRAPLIESSHRRNSIMGNKEIS